jgi:hypothetical protein
MSGRQRAAAPGKASMMMMTKRGALAFVCALACAGVLAGWSAVAQRSAAATVFIDEMTTSEVQAAVASGKTTLLLLFGGLHENSYGRQDTAFSGPAHDGVVTGKHNFEGNYEARRIAEELGNALAYYAFPYAPNDRPHKDIAGTISLREDTFIALIEDLANSAIATAHFKHVVIIGNHGTGEPALKRAAEGLDPVWAPKGARVVYLPVYEASKRELSRYLTELKDPNVPPECRSPKTTSCQTAVDDYGRMLFLDKQYVRMEKAPPALAKFLTPAVGKAILEQYVALAVDQIRKAVSNTATNQSH